MTPVVGIDLGTTNSVVAVIGAEGRPRALPLRDGGTLLPSVIGFRGGEVLIGAEAKEAQRNGDARTVAFFKRSMGERHYAFEAGGRTWSPVDLSCLVLQRLKEDAEAALGEPVRKAVITVPAYFRDPARRATLEAGRAAGLEVVQVVNEPTAAAIAFGAAHPGLMRRVLVYDLGGGTFDVTLLELDEKSRVLTSQGDRELGGKDWDDEITALVIDAFEREHGISPEDDLVALATIGVEAEMAKKRLTASRQVELAVQAAGRITRLVLTRATFEEVTRGLLARTGSLVELALQDAGLTTASVDDVVLVGGSTRMPMVRAWVEATFGRPALGGIDPDLAVAYGAAILADRYQSGVGRQSLRGTEVQDVTNHSLGMIAVSADRSHFINTPILPKDRPIPGSETRPYQHRTRGGGRSRLEIFVTQGETDNPQDVAYLGRYVVEDVPGNSSGMTVLEVSYSYDASGTVGVKAKVKGQGELPVVVEPLPEDIPARFARRPDEVFARPEPLTVYLCFDVSGSMCGTPLAEAKRAARSFLANVDLSTTMVGVMAVADRCCTLTHATHNVRQVEQGIDGLDRADVGGANRAHPFDEALARLGRSVPGRRFLVVLADGVWGNQPAAVAAAKRCHQAGIDVVAIGFGGADRRFLADIASAPQDAIFTDLSKLTDTFCTIAQVMTATSPGMLGGADSASGGLGLLRFLRRGEG